MAHIVNNKLLAIIVTALEYVILAAMKREQKKKPSDYPLVTFRVGSEHERSELMDQVEKICSRLNADRSEDEKLIRKNDVMAQALRNGLEVMLKARKGKK